MMKKEYSQQESGTEEVLRRGGECIAGGGLVVFPTETVYGLGANAYDGQAVGKIFQAKGRPADNPLIVHISRIEQLYEVAQTVSPAAKLLAETFWPGPLTMVLPRGEKIPAVVSAGLDTVAVRMPAHPIAQKLITYAGVPIAAPSANLSGRPSPTKAAHAAQDLRERVDMILDGGECKVGLESTVISLTEQPPRLLRPGGITAEQLKGVLGEIQIDRGVLEELPENVKAASPGMKHKHYAPGCKVILLDGESEQYIQYVNQMCTKESGVLALCYREDVSQLRCPAVVLGGREELSAQAAGLFSCLRELDVLHGKIAYAHLPESTGVGLAVYNRLLRAAGFQVIHLNNEGVD